jgi:hypothetical protein
MKLGRRHLIGSLVLLAASVVYNVWIFTGASDRPAGGGDTPAPVEAPLAGPPADEGVRPLDPAQVAALPEVGLDRAPVWPRDPFANPRRRAPEVVVAAPEPVAEVDPVVASILYAADRRFAMINGRIVRIGDQVGSAVVVDILPNAVVIESAAQGRRTVDLRTPRTVATGR